MRFAETEHASIVERTAERRRAKIRRGHYPRSGMGIESPTGSEPMLELRYRTHCLL
jgi:hypothetical protein